MKFKAFDSLSWGVALGLPDRGRGLGTPDRGWGPLPSHSPWQQQGGHSEVQPQGRGVLSPSLAAFLQHSSAALCWEPAHPLGIPLGILHLWKETKLQLCSPFHTQLQPQDRSQGTKHSLFTRAGWERAAAGMRVLGSEQ